MKISLKPFLILSMSALVMGMNSYHQGSTKKNSSKEVTVYQSGTCGCCKKWAGHLKDNGFNVKSVYVDDVTAIKVNLKVPTKLASCHTAVINGYLVEGHVPATAITNMLNKNPPIVGISVPGMPMGSPGMEGSVTEKYEVIAFKDDGTEEVFMKF